MYRKGWISIIAMLMALVLVAAACGDDDSESSDDGDSSSEEGNGIAEAEEAVAQLTERPSEIPVTTPLEGEVGEGSAAWLQCAIPDCEILGPPLEEGLAEFGWTMDTIDAGLSPEEVKSGWGVAASQEPDAVFATGFPRVIFEEELGQLADQGADIVNAFVAEGSGDGVSAVISGTPTSTAIGTAFADWVLAEQGTDANVLLVHSSTFPTLLDVRAGFEERFTELCPDCPVEVMDVPAEDFGANLPAEVVAQLRSLPDVNYVVADEGNMLLGLPQAMAEAGMTDISVVGQYPSETSLEYLADGSIVKAIVMPSMGDAMWNMVDAMARTETGQPVDENEAAGPLWIVTPETASELEYPFSLVPDYQEQYQELWSAVTG